MTELEQFIQRLEELERTMTKGPWEEREVMGQRFIAAPGPRPGGSSPNLRRLK